MPNAKSKIDIYFRIDELVYKIILFLRLVPKNLENNEILKQIIRSACSIGANANEADGTLTKKEFLHTFSIARKESKETLYWLRLLTRLNPNLVSKTKEIEQECSEIVAILSKILISSRKNDL